MKRFVSCAMAVMLGTMALSGCTTSNQQTQAAATETVASEKTEEAKAEETKNQPMTECSPGWFFVALCQ